MHNKRAARKGITMGRFWAFDSTKLSLLLATYWIVAQVASAGRAPTPVTIIPLESYLRAQTVIHAEVEGQPGTFLFDTGEGVSGISPELAQKINCHPWGQISGFRMSGERLTSQHCDQLRFTLNGHSFSAPAVGILDIMKLLGPDLPRIDGAIGLDLFAGQTITIVPRKSLIIESKKSLAARIKTAKELPIRLVRDVEGLALCVDVAVSTSAGTAWMELDSGNGGSLVIADHIAPLLGLKTQISDPVQTRFRLADGIEVGGLARTRDLIMDGNIGAQFLNHWILTLDLARGRAWLGALSTGSSQTQ
jgi:Aspartyl protease